MNEKKNVKTNISTVKLTKLAHDPGTHSLGTNGALKYLMCIYMEIKSYISVSGLVP